MPFVGIIDVKAREVRLFNSQSDAMLTDAKEAAGLKPFEVDHGTITQQWYIIVDEYGLLKGKSYEYFRFGRQLFNGSAVLYHTDEAGETIDVGMAVITHLNNCRDVEWFDNLHQVEEAIADGRLERPQTSINGEVVWSWNKGQSDG